MGQTPRLTSSTPLRAVRDLTAGSTARAALLLTTATTTLLSLLLLFLVGVPSPLSSTSSPLLPLPLPLLLPSLGIGGRALAGRRGWLDSETAGEFRLEVNHHRFGWGLREIQAVTGSACSVLPCDSYSAS